MQTPKHTSLSALIALSLLLTACSSTSENVESDVTSAGDTTTTTVETEPDQTDRAAARDSLPDDLDFGGETLRVFHRSGFESELEGDSSGDILSSAIYNRNEAVSERLNVNIEYFTQTDDSPETVVKSVLAGDDAIDVVLHTEWKIVGLVTQGAFRDVSNEKYLDLSREWWLPNVTNELNILPDKTILFTGEMLIGNIGQMSAIYVNKDMFTNMIGDIDEFYQLILDGGWTQDLFFNYVESAYSDLNGDSQVALGDQFGFMGDRGSSVDNLTFSTDVSYYTRGDDGLPELTMNSERMVKLVDNLYSLYYENKGMVYVEEQDLVPQFVENKSLFMGYRLNTATNGSMREMKSDYGIIPYPKLDEQQEKYISLIHNASPVIAIPVTCQRMDMVTATLEALSSESYRNVTPVYYEAALKTKYTRDDISSQMIDLIYDGAHKDIIYDLNPGGAGLITREFVVAESNNFASYYSANESKYLAGLEQLIEDYSALQ